MPRAANHHRDDPCMASLYREWDLVDLVDLIAWMRAYPSGSDFSLTCLHELRRASGMTCYSLRLVKRIVRVGVEEAWLNEPQRGRYVIGPMAPATLPLVNMIVGHLADLTPRLEGADLQRLRVSAEAFVANITGRRAHGR